MSDCIRCGDHEASYCPECWDGLRAETIKAVRSLESGRDDLAMEILWEALFPGVNLSARGDGLSLCPVCEGSGLNDGKPCPNCNGVGYVTGLPGMSKAERRNGKTMTQIDEYDPSVHVTAGELRARGIPVPADIPDVGVVRRAAIRSGPVVVDSTREETDAGIISAKLNFEIDEPFKWVESTISIPKEATQPCPDCNGSGDAPPKGPSLAGTTPDDIERIAFGAEPIADLVKSPCPTCDGLGFVPRDGGRKDGDR